MTPAMTVVTTGVAPQRPVEVSVHARTASPPARITVLIVTWNRRDMVARVLESLSRQRYGPQAMDVVVIDNASTDGTTEFLRDRFRPERLVANAAIAAHEPRFTASPTGSTANTLGFASLTVITNQNNFGGCGGFNTGFAWAEHASSLPLPEGSGSGESIGHPLPEGGGRGEGSASGQDRASASSTPRPSLSSPPDFLWLVDDDADVPEDALQHLTAAALADPTVGLVGSRTVDIADRLTTIETTIYLDPDGGNMRDEPPPHHRLFDEHMRWIRSLGWSEEVKETFGRPTRGLRPFTGVRTVEVVSACSMLARWSAVVGTKEKPGVGFWDKRYFIYCDDADWCLRFGKAGWRVVLSLDAVVYHTPWNLKLTPARIYYAQRNAIWMIQKIMPKWQLRRVTSRWMKNLLKDSLRAAFHRRLFHADIIRSTGEAVAAGIAGKTGTDGPPPMPVFEALEQSGALRPGNAGRVALMITPFATVKWGEDLIAHIRAELAARARQSDEPRYTFIARNDADGLDRLPPGSVIFGRRRLSRIKKTLLTLRLKPDAVVVFDQTNDLPLVRGRHNVHIDMKKPTIAQLERDGLGPRLGFLARWLRTALRCAWYGLTVKPYVRSDRYG